MINIDKKPNELEYTDNGLKFEVSSDKAYSDSNKAALSIEVGASLNNGEFLSISWGNGLKIVRFDVVDGIDDSGYQLNDGDEIQQIFEGFSSNFELHNNFDITATQNEIILTAKEEGSYYSMVFFTTAQGLAESANVAGTDRIKSSGFKIMSEILLKTGADFDIISTSFTDVDEKAVSEVKPGLQLKKYIDTDLPDYNQNEIKKCIGIPSIYKIAFAERYDNTIKRLYYSDELYAINGIGDSDLLSHLTSGKNYLLDENIIKIETYKNAQQYLYFYNYLNETFTIQERVRVFYTDGTSYVANKFTKQCGGKHECFIVPTGYEILNLEALNPSKTIYKYEIWLEKGGGLVISKSIFYYLINKPLNARIFLFKNKRGGMETVICGKQKKVYETKKSELRTDNTYSNSIDDKYMLFEQETGYKSKTEILHMQELIESEKVYADVNGKFEKISIADGSFLLLDEKEDLNNFSFKYRIENEKN